MIRNSKNIKRHAYQKKLCNPSRRELRAAMMIPLMYEQLKREKLKIHKSRCVCVCVVSGSKGWAQEVPRQGLGVIWEPQLLFCKDACQLSQWPRSSWFHSSLAQQTLSLMLSYREIMKQNLCLGVLSIICDCFIGFCGFHESVEHLPFSYLVQASVLSASARVHVFLSFSSL